MLVTFFKGFLYEISADALFCAVKYAYHFFYSTNFLEFYRKFQMIPEIPRILKNFI